MWLTNARTSHDSHGVAASNWSGVTFASIDRVLAIACSRPSVAMVDSLSGEDDTMGGWRCRRTRAPTVASVDLFDGGLSDSGLFDSEVMADGYDSARPPLHAPIMERVASALGW